MFGPGIKTAGVFTAIALLGCSYNYDGPTWDTSSEPDKEAGVTDAAGDAPAKDAAGDGSSTDAARNDGGAALSCAKTCHGSATNAAPPMSLKGQTATTERGVGAHQAHLKKATWHAQVTCNDCHLVPTKVSDKGHIDTALPAEVTFGATAKADSASPAFKASSSSVTCSGVYCHGATLSGGTITTPSWTKVDGTAAKCGACHGLPPTQNHSTSTNCVTCHKAVVDANKKIIAPSLHIDGKISASGGHPAGYGTGSVHSKDFYADPKKCTTCHGANYTGGSAKSCDSCHSGWKTNCTFCHGGTDNQTGAPPEAVDGKTAVTVAGVGRHTEHVEAGTTHDAFGCVLCHKVPQSALSAGHIDPSPAELTFSGIAAGASYTASTHTCQVYCHGDGKSGSKGSAVWTGSLSGGCAACHDDETAGSGITLGGRHKRHVILQNIKCAVCHECVVDNTKKITSTTKHVNGKPDVCSSILTYTATTKSCTPPCHNTRVW